LGLFFAEIFRMQRIKQLQIKKDFRAFYGLAFLGILIFLFETIYIIQVFNSGYIEWIVWGIIELGYLIVVIRLLFPLAGVKKRTQDEARYWKIREKYALKFDRG
jgi:hypothetical protein